MIVLAVKTDQPAAELHLYKDGQEIAQDVWQSDRQLETELLAHIRDILKVNQLAYPNLNGLIFYQGPGSYTGLRIGAAVVNSLSQALSITIASAGGENWLKTGWDAHQRGKTSSPAAINYGDEARKPA